MTTKRPPHFYVQSGVIALREEGGELKVLLVTSRKNTRWVVPKGIVEDGLSPARSAMKEAWEEGGIKGRVDEGPVGAYSYEKWGGTCHVEVFCCHVDSIEEDWPEKGVRRRRWLSPDKAADEVREEALTKLIRKVGEE